MGQVETGWVELGGPPISCSSWRLANEKTLTLEDEEALKEEIRRLAALEAVIRRLNRPGFDGGSFYLIPTPVGAVCWSA